MSQLIFAGFRRTKTGLTHLWDVIFIELATYELVTWRPSRNLQVLTISERGHHRPP